MNHADKAVNKYNDGFNCAQSIVFAFSDALKLEARTAFKAATGFGAGLGRKQEVCGAVTGGVFVLGLLLGRGEADGLEKQDLAYAAVRTLMDGFERKFGTVICRRLLDGCELLSTEGQARFKDERMKEELCSRYVAQAAALLDEIITGPGL